MTWLDDNRGWLERAREKWAPASSHPLRLRAWLDSELGWDGYDGITLEGALQCAVVLRETGRVPGDVFGDCPVDAPVLERDIQIPIADTLVQVDGTLFPLALITHARFSPDARQTIRAQRSRPRADSYQATKVNTAEGATKAVNGKVATVTCSYLDFWCIGDRVKLDQLLGDCCQLGRSRVGGMGAVSGWEVSEGPDVTIEAAHIMRLRTRPYDSNDIGLFDGTAEERFSTLRAPYWHQATRTRCVVPVQRVAGL